MKKTKRPLPAEPRDAPVLGEERRPDPPALGSLAAAVQKLGLSAEAILIRAIAGELALRQARAEDVGSLTGLDPWLFLSALPEIGGAPLPEMKVLRRRLASRREALFSPRLLEALFGAARRCQETPFRVRTVEVPSGKRYIGAARPVRTSAPMLILYVAKVLTSHWEEPEAEARAVRALALKLKIEAEADRVADDRPSVEAQAAAIAKRKVAKGSHSTPAAVEKQIERARKARPDLPWPKKRARRL